MKLFFVALITVVAFTVNHYGQEKPATSGGQKECQKDERPLIPPFRYTIVAETSKIQRFVNEGRDSREIVVLMEDAAFVEENLKILFNLLSRRYSDRSGLYVQVHTSLDAIPTPEEFDMMNLYGPLENYRQFKNAFFSHDNRGKSVQYEIPGKIKPQYIYLGPSDFNE